MFKTETLIVGAGLTGLACARTLQEQGRDFILIEAAEVPGGRVRTFQKEGFLLDRGFQLFLEAYPEGRRWLDYEALDFCPFYPGAQIMLAEGSCLLGDPLRKPLDLFATVLAQVGTSLDKLKVLHLRRYLQKQSLDALMRNSSQGTDVSTAVALRNWEFSEPFIQQFFQPFLGGVFLDPELSTSASMFYFVMKMFAEGRAVLPARGMQQIPEQMARWIPEEQLWYRCALQQITTQGDGLQQWHTLTLKREEQEIKVQARQLVMATDARQAHAILGHRVPPISFQGSRTLYFVAEQAPVTSPILVLNGTGAGPVNHLVNLSQVSPAYAPPGQHLISVSVLGHHQTEPLTSLLPAIQKQMEHWFDGNGQWHLLSDMFLPDSLPQQFPPRLHRFSRTPLGPAPGILVGGDYTETGSIQGALQAGRKLALSLIDEVP